MNQKKPLTITDFWGVKKQIDAEVTRLGWSTDTCIAYIQKHYSKHSRLVMTDDYDHVREIGEIEQELQAIANSLTTDSMTVSKLAKDITTRRLLLEAKHGIRGEE